MLKNLAYKENYYNKKGHSKMSDSISIENSYFNTAELTAKIVSAWVSNNAVRPDDLIETIKSVHTAIASLQNSTLNIKAEEVTAVEAPKPFVSVKKSVSDNQITCLCCGKSFKSIKRHIGTSHGFTPDEYRAHFSLPHDYPMVAPGYSKERSDIALKLGLGRKPAA